MPNTGHSWSTKELHWLEQEVKNHPADITQRQLATELSRKSGGRISMDAIRKKLLHIKSSPVSPSTYPVYDTPLEMVGDAVIMTDIEFPFHHAEFINRVLDLANSWGIRNLILGGDVLHFDSLSGWEPSWSDTNDGGLPEA